MKTKRWAVLGVTAAALAAQLYAQTPTPQIPVYNFRSPEDTRKFGMKPEDIKAGVKPDFSRIREQLVVVPVRGQVHLVGGGGNIAMQVGDEGVLLVDSGVGPAAERVVAAYKRATEMPLRWIINTSVDADHVGGNAAVAVTGLPGNGGGPGGGGGGPGGFGGPGGGGGGNPANQVQAASIVAHETVLTRMNATDGTPQAIPVAAWPTSAFFTPKKTMYFNGEPIEILHLPAAHSDGDVLVHFRSSDVIAAGDAYSNDRFPQFDPAQYIGNNRGPARITKILEPVAQRHIGYALAGGFGRADRIVWVDGRPHPSEFSEHTWSGFSTGTWEDGTFVITTTHLKTGFIRRNGAYTSPYAKMVEYYHRTGTDIHVFAWIDDPLTQDEPMIRTYMLRWNPAGNTQTGNVFESVDELGDKPLGWVPHWPLGTRHTEFGQRFKIPFEATLGGAATLYPEYQIKLQQLMQQPAR